MKHDTATHTLTINADDSGEMSPSGAIRLTQ